MIVGWEFVRPVSNFDVFCYRTLFPMHLLDVACCDLFLYVFVHNFIQGMPQQLRVLSYVAIFRSVEV